LGDTKLSKKSVDISNVGGIILYKDINILLSVTLCCNEQCGFNSGLEVQGWLEAGEAIDNTTP